MIKTRTGAQRYNNKMNKIFKEANEAKDKWQKTLEKYRDEAYEYYSNCHICPDGEDIVFFVCDCVEDESGYYPDVDAIAKFLNITLEN